MPLQYPSEAVTSEQLDGLLDNGYRRSGYFYYRTRCPNCCACEPLRIDVGRFEPSKSLKRVLKRGDAAIEHDIDEPQCDDERVRLFNLHRNSRNMARGDGDSDQSGYDSFLCSSFNPTAEITYRIGGRLVAVAITDVGVRSLSAVYCFFDPEFDHFSLGTYSILKQWEVARRFGMQWLYLGMYVSENRHLRYKARYMPHERFINGEWSRFEDQSK